MLVFAGLGGGQWRVDMGWLREREVVEDKREERETENRDILFLLSSLYYFNVLYSKIKTKILGEL